MSDLASYELVGAAIRCRICGRTSHHPVDVAEKYCANCHRDHETMTVALQTIAIGIRLVAPAIAEAELVRVFALLLASIDLKPGSSQLASS